MTLYDLWLVFSFCAIALGAAFTAQPFMAATRDPNTPINRLRVALGAGLFIAGVISLVWYQAQNQP